MFQLNVDNTQADKISGIRDELVVPFQDVSEGMLWQNTHVNPFLT